MDATTVADVVLAGFQAPEASPEPPTTTPRWWTVALAGAALLALALRLWRIDEPVWGGEGLTLYLARHGGSAPDGIYPPFPHLASWWLLEPLHVALTLPGAAFGLAGARVSAALIGACLPVALAFALVTYGTPRRLAVAAAFAAAVLPALLLPGSRIEAATPAALAALASVWALARQRPLVAAGLAVATVWTDATTLWFPPALLAWTLVRGRVDGRIRGWPLRLDHASSALVAAWPLAWLPTAYSMVRTGPGAAVPLLAEPLDLLLVPLLLLAWPAARRAPWALLAVVGTAAALVAPASLRPEAPVLATTLLLAAAAAGVGEGWNRPPAPRDSANLHSTRGRRFAAAGFALGLLVASLVLPAGSAVRPGEAPSLAQAVAPSPQGGLSDAMDAVPERGWDKLFTVDLWLAEVPVVADRASFMGWSHSTFVPTTELWRSAIEEGTNATLVRVADTPMNAAIRATYADCVLHENAGYVVIDGPACSGRGDQLATEYEERAGQRPQG